MKNRVALAAGLYAAVAVGQDASSCPSILIPKNGAPVVASGWQAQLVAGGFTKPRSIEFDSTGALIVLESGKGISRHRFTDNGGTCLSANHSHMLVELTTVRPAIGKRPVTDDPFMLTHSSSTTALRCPTTAKPSTLPLLSPSSPGTTMLREEPSRATRASSSAG